MKNAMSRSFRAAIAAMLAVLLSVAFCIPAFGSSEGSAAEGASWADPDGVGSHAAGVMLGIADDAKKAADEIDKQAKKAAVAEKALAKARKQSSSTDYFIAVDLGAKRTMVFKWDGDDWNLVKNWVCSVGAPESPTVVGTFEVADRGESFSQDGYTCYYYTQFDGPYLFHSVKYDEGTDHIQDGRLGEAVSEGCVRLKIKNAKWIHDAIPSGTRVVTYE